MQKNIQKKFFVFEIIPFELVCLIVSIKERMVVNRSQRVNKQCKSFGYH